MDEINKDTCRIILAAFMEQESLSSREVAKAIGCPESSIVRILARETYPSDDMIKQVGILITIGYKQYLTLLKAQKEKVSEGLGALGGGLLGFGAISAAVNALGVPGRTAAGITSGLATLGSIVRGGMLRGVSVAAAIPIAVGALGYSIIKGVKYFASDYQLNSTRLNPFWEKPISQ